MKRILLAFMALLVAQPAFAQTWGAGPSGGVTPVWSTNVRGDGSTTAGGTPPATSIEPADIASSGTTTGLIQGGSSYILATGPGDEMKLRLLCNTSHAATEDPILYPGQSNAGHKHTFASNPLGGKNATYATLRASTDGTCGGKQLNGTSYWEPSLCTASKGLELCLKPDNFVFYYVRNFSDKGKLTRLFNGLSFIAGVNLADPTNAIRNAEVPSGYLPSGTGWGGWKCELPAGSATQYAPVAGGGEGGITSPALETASHTDPFQGLCVKGSKLFANFNGPDCWNGRNLTSPNGRDHVRYSLQKFAGGAASYCPDGWFEMPALVATPTWILKKDSEPFVDQWYFASDSMVAGALRGSTGHFDWMNGWDPAVLKKWQAFCLGIDFPGLAGTGAQCDFSTITATERLFTDHIVYLNGGTMLGRNRYFPIPTGTKARLTVKGH